MPQYVLQGRYIEDGSGLHAVVLVLDYRDITTARGFLGAYSRDISNCPPPATHGPRSPYVRAVTVLETKDTTIRDRWVEYGAGAGQNVWHEVIIREGARVGLADVEAAPGVTPDLTRVTAVLRSVVGG